MVRLIAFVLSLGLLAVAPPAQAASDIVIGYLDVKGDQRYSKKRLYARFLLEPLGRPFRGAKVALSEVKFHGAAIDAGFKLKKARGRTAADLIGKVDQMAGEGVHFFILDAPAEIVAEVAAATADRDILLFNISARDDRLRQDDCQPQLMHVIPSYAMLMDALSQYLVFRKWRDILILEGPSEADKALSNVFQRSARKFGLKIADLRSFILSNDPRQRDQNNTTLLTVDGDYEVVFVADTDGEFARSVPYQTAQPRLTVGTAGFGAMAWHWAWERHGAPQLEKRFRKAAKRPMRDVDWAAWVAVKAVAEAVQRTSSADFATLKNWLMSEEFVLDTFKGTPANFRSWNNQLRQPILLATDTWVVDRAPLEGFIHRKNDLDTLGFDAAESSCALN